MKVRKKPVVVDAEPVKERTVVHTLEGDMTAEPGDYIITGVRGERYPIKADIFAETYDPVGPMSEDREPTEEEENIVSRIAARWEEYKTEQEFVGGMLENPEVLGFKAGDEMVGMLREYAETNRAERDKEWVAAARGAIELLKELREEHGEDWDETNTEKRREWIQEIIDALAALVEGVGK